MAEDPPWKRNFLWLFYSEIERLVENLEIRDGKEFSYGNINYVLLIFDHEGDIIAEPTDIEYKKWKIHLFNGSERERRIGVLHEIVETQLVERQSRFSGRTGEIDKFAHQEALRYEQLYVLRKDGKN